MMNFIIFLGSLNPYGIINWIAAVAALYGTLYKKYHAWAFLTVINVVFGALYAYVDITASSGV